MPIAASSASASDAASSAPQYEAGAAVGSVQGVSAASSVQASKTILTADPVVGRSRHTQLLAMTGAALAFAMLPLFNAATLQYMLSTALYTPVAGVGITAGNAVGALHVRMHAASSPHASVDSECHACALLVALQFRAYFNTIVAQASAVAAAYCFSKARSGTGERRRSFMNLSRHFGHGSTVHAGVFM